jgi:para-aminobenzoate synthetase component 1
MTHTNHIREQLNRWGATRQPFLLLADFEGQAMRAWPLKDLDPRELQFAFPSAGNALPQSTEAPPPLIWEPQFPKAPDYARAYARVQSGLQRGDSFLVNLTAPTPVRTNWDTLTVFQQTSARYRLWWRDQFVCFSPEPFVQINGHTISSYPMKGTLAAHLPGQLLLDNEKERAEHATIVDLIRNDLSQVASRVRVAHFRYLEQLDTHRGALWQTSSRIQGQLSASYHHELGDLLLRLLPAGSISGAPKPATVRIIQEAEGQARGYYTGIAALWDGYQLDSCVLIRFLENSPDGLRYWSGGGITAYSQVEEEYRELKEKVYLPLRMSSLATL